MNSTHDNNVMTSKINLKSDKGPSINDAQKVRPSSNMTSQSVIYPMSKEYNMAHKRKTLEQPVSRNILYSTTSSPNNITNY